MRRLIATFLLVLLPLQAVWAAVMPYCQHESAPRQPHHLGHHQHHEHGVVDGGQTQDVDQANAENGGSAQEHDHHCCGFASLPQRAHELPVPPPHTQSNTSPLEAYTSFDARRIERPNWPISL